MKKLLIIFAIACSFSNAIAQHYGGITFTPYAVENNWSWFGNELFNKGINSPKSTFGYSFGYQGLLMPQKRFSFSYGLLYNAAYNEATFDPPRVGYNYDLTETFTGIGSWIEVESIQAPLWWRYNILKNRNKFQPFVAVSTTIALPLKYEQTYYYLEKPPIINDFNQGIELNFELGIGVNYYTDNWLFTLQPTYSASYFRKFGLGISVMRKF